MQVLEQIYFIIYVIDSEDLQRMKRWRKRTCLISHQNTIQWPNSGRIVSDDMKR